MDTKPRVYRPQPVYIPEDAGIRRDAITDWTDDGATLAPEIRARCDTRTLFYDIFPLRDELACIGPPFWNLGPPQRICCGAGELEFRLEYAEVDNLATAMPSLLFIKIPPQNGAQRLDLQFHFREFAVSASCNTVPAFPELRRRRLGLVTLQKDNPVPWIRDWILWHSRVHGVQRIALYDNGSRNFSELPEALARLGKEPEIILAHWPFPHGPVTHPVNRFCQAGALNHFRLLFGASVDWALNLDIDEYLYLEDKQSLKRYLAQPQLASRVAVYIGSLLFPADSAIQPRQARFFRYTRRYREKYHPLSAFKKYIFQPAKVTALHIHKAHIPAAGLQKLKAAWRRRRFRRRAHYWQKINSPAQQKNAGPGDASPNSAPLLCARDKSPEKKLFFCHFKGLNSGWHTPQKNYQVGSSGAQKRHAQTLRQRFANLSEVSAEQLTLDCRVKDLAARFGWSIDAAALSRTSERKRVMTLSEN